MTLDWVVLTGALVGTGMAVLGQLENGLETASVATATKLRGEIVRSSFAGELCSGGITALQAREDQRLASADAPRININSWMATYHDGVGDEAITSEYARLQDSVGSDDIWSRDRTIMTALECEMVLRGLD